MHVVLLKCYHFHRTWWMSQHFILYAHSNFYLVCPYFLPTLLLLLLSLSIHQSFPLFLFLSSPSSRLTFIGVIKGLSPAQLTYYRAIESISREAKLFPCKLWFILIFQEPIKQPLLKRLIGKEDLSYKATQTFLDILLCFASSCFYFGLREVCSVFFLHIRIPQEST